MKQINSKIVHQFEGYIEGVMINRENIYYSVEWILEQIINNFNIVVTEELIRELSSEIEYIYMKSDYFQMQEFEDNINRNVDEKILKIEYEEVEYYFPETNKILRELDIKEKEY